MADVHDKATRSYNMSRIKGKNTKPEIKVRKFLHANGFRFRIHVNKLPGKPDIVLNKYKTVINVHGCYFHRHTNCKYCTTPSNDSKTDWLKKFADTVKRDKKNDQALRDLNWKVITIWECELMPDKIEKTLAFLRKKLLKQLSKKRL